MTNVTLKIIGVFIIGAALGTVTGLLIAPGTGSNTRQQLSKKSRKLKNEIADAVSGYFENLKNRKDAVSNELYAANANNYYNVKNEEHSL